MYFAAIEAITKTELVVVTIYKTFSKSTSSPPTTATQTRCIRTRLRTAHHNQEFVGPPSTAYAAVIWYGLFEFSAEMRRSLLQKVKPI
jgi:hypothetical protein